MSDQGVKRKRLLITGAGGRVGTALRTHLRDRYDLRLLDIKPIPDADPADQQVVADVSRLDDMVEATVGIDAIAHLALATQGRHATRASVARRTLEVDMPALHAVYEAARINKVGCVVLASTNHVTGLNEEDKIVSRPDMSVRPDGIYGAGKAFGEALGRYYAERQGVRVMCLRIANFNGRDEPGRDYAPGEARWLSPRDVAQLVWRCIEAQHVPFGIFYAVSGGAEKKWDLTATREVLGYEPADDGSLEHWRAKYR